MTELDLDRVYTQMCQALSTLGEAQTSQALSRFALLAMLEIDDADKIEKMILRAMKTD